jgi:hypothetical protein
MSERKITDLPLDQMRIPKPTPDELASLEPGSPAVVLALYRIARLGERVTRSDGARMTTDDEIEQLSKRVRALEICPAIDGAREHLGDALRTADEATRESVRLLDERDHLADAIEERRKVLAEIAEALCVPKGIDIVSFARGLRIDRDNLLRANDELAATLSRVRAAIGGRP